MADVDKRLRAHLARVVGTPEPVGWEDRVSHWIPGGNRLRRHAWVTQVVAATALVAVGVGVFFGLRASRQNAAVKPKPTPVTTPAPSPTASATAAAGPFFHTMRMLTPQLGWALTEQGVLRTTDGWAHWFNVGPPGVTALAAGSQFVSETNAWVAAGSPAATRGTSTIYHTTDGGASWGRSTLTDPSALGPGEVDFIDATHGWLYLSYGVAAGSEGGAIYQTVDGGAHWVKVEQTVGGVEEAPGSLPFGCDKAGVSFIDATTGWATGSCAGGGPFFFVTHDGGRTWRTQSFSIPGGTSGGGGFTTSPPVFFPDRSGYFLLGGNGTVVYTTTDGGTTWLPHQLPVGSSRLSFGSIAFTSLSDGWLISGDGTLLYRTNDGGQHWTSFRPSSQLTGLQVFAAVDASHAIAVLNPSGSQNFITATSDGGRTWRQIEP